MVSLPRSFIVTPPRAVKTWLISWVQVPPGNGSPRPEAIEAVMEVTKWPEPSV